MCVCVCVNKAEKDEYFVCNQKGERWTKKDKIRENCMGKSNSYFFECDFIAWEFCVNFMDF